jgi:hypothetical protein
VATNAGVQCNVSVATSTWCAIDCPEGFTAPQWQFTIYVTSSNLGTANTFDVIESATLDDAGLDYCQTRGNGTATPL